MSKHGAYDLTAEQLRQWLRYDLHTGLFTWLQMSGKRKPAGSVAGGLDDDGYVVIRLDKTLYRAHRLAWLYVTGDWPALDIDHQNGVVSDNCWVNLRLATNSQNQANRHVAIGRSGMKGVHWNEREGLWMAQIKINGKQHRLGYFSNPIEAREAYYTAAVVAFKEFARKV